MAATPVAGQPTAWILREARDADRDAILALRQRVFSTEDPEKQDPSFWQWEFRSGPEGNARIFVAEDMGKIVGHYAMVPQDFLLEGEPCKGSIVVDLMTHPDYRRQGIFNRIAKFAFAAASDQIGFASAYPIRKESMAGFLSIGWVEQFKIPVLVRPLSWRAIAERYRLPVGSVLELLARPWRRLRALAAPTLRTGEVIRALGVAECAQIALVASEGLGAEFTVRVRSESFFRWRYFASPIWKYEVKGLFNEGSLRAYVVTRRARLLDTDSLAIVDLGGLHGADREVRLLLDAEVSHGVDSGMAVAGAMITRGNRYYRILRGAGFYPGPHSFSFILYGREPAARRLANSGLRWFLTWGDTDGV